MSSDLAALRDDFPALHQQVNGKPLFYLDNGATTQKPRAVIDAIVRYYERDNANIHRAVHTLSQRATHAFEEGRLAVGRFINAPDAQREVLFVRGTTEGVNLVAHSVLRPMLKAGDEVLVTAFEHHSNIVPYQMACLATGAKLRVLPMTADGELEYEKLEELVTPRTRFIAASQVSNALGTVTDIGRIVAAAKKVGALVLLDGAQWVGHFPTDVQAFGCDFYVFSGHKLFGPTGIGVLWGRRALLEHAPPFMGGGDMIRNVSFLESTYADLPNRFEAGTPDIAGVVGLHAAIDYLQSAGMSAIAAHDEAITAYAVEQLESVDGVRVIGNPQVRSGAVSFVVEGMGSLDVGIELDLHGIAVRTGHHCAEPVMTQLALTECGGTVRASFAFYTSKDDIDALVTALRTIIKKRVVPTLEKPVHEEKQDVQWPAAVADSPNAAADELVDIFEFLGDWDARYQQLVEMGDQLPALPADARTEANRVHGCQSTVHLIARDHPGDAAKLDLLADSDAAIVRGLIAVLLRVYSGQKAKDILKFDEQAFLKRLGLDQHLSMGRRNGLAGMIERIKKEATARAA